MMSSRSKSMEMRKSTFKNRGMTSDESRRRREEASVEIRKAKREDSLNKKRSVAMPMSDGSNTDSLANSSRADQEHSSDASTSYNAALEHRLPILTANLYSDDLKAQLDSAVEFRQILSKEKYPPIDEVIKCNVVPRFVDFLAGPPANVQIMDEETAKKYFSLQFESAWVLTNIASGNSDQTRVVVESGAVPLFITLLSSQSADVREQAVWALGNISGDSPLCRDFVLSKGIVDPVLAVIRNELAQSPNRPTLIQNATWTVSNLCRGKPAPSWEVIAPVLPVLAQLVYSNDAGVLIDACWALSYISDASSDRIKAIIDAGILSRIVNLLGHSNSAIQSPALRTIGNIVTGDDGQTQAVIDAGALSALGWLLSSTKASIQKEACWTISNITAGNVQQIQAVIDSNIIPVVIKLLGRGDFKTRKEACWAISNATSAKYTDPDQIRYLVQQGCIGPLCDMLASQDNKISIVALDGLSNILEIGEMDSVHNDNMNNYAHNVEECGGVEAICELQNHQNPEIYLKSKNIIDRFFGGEGDEDLAYGEDSNVPRGDYSNNGQFDFSGGTMQIPQGGFNFAS